jgi:23S rRNA (adenine2503-C2)-methyltransferase
MTNILELNLDDLEKLFSKQNIPKYKAKQVFEWIYKKQTIDFSEMTNISNADKTLFASFLKTALPSYEKFFGEKTVKLLIKLSEKDNVESVIIPSEKGNTLCMSTQVGCPLKCDFCETGITGFVRNMNVSEIITQYIVAQKEGYEISRIVFMGMGEPLLNLDNVLVATDILNNPKGASLGIRKFTLSTAGLIPEIKKLMQKNYKINLAVSLHAPNDKLRSRIMPINNQYNIKDLLLILLEYRQKTGRRISLEYILLKGVNDSLQDAQQLSNLVKGTDFHINLIEFNQTSSKYQKSDNLSIFSEFLLKKNINVTIRKSAGSDIKAGCGMLSGKK